MVGIQDRKNELETKQEAMVGDRGWVIGCEVDCSCRVLCRRLFDVT